MEMEIRTRSGLNSLLVILLLLVSAAPLMAPTSSAESGRSSSAQATTLFSSMATTEIANAMAGAPDTTVMVRLPVGAHVTDARVGLSGASNMGWASLLMEDQSDWESGVSAGVDSHSDDLTLGQVSPSSHFFSHGPNDIIGANTTANMSDQFFAVHQPATSSINETLLSLQSSTLSNFPSQYSGAMIRFGGHTFQSSWNQGTPFNSTISAIHSNNGTVAQHVFLDKGTCTIPSTSSSWSSAYGFLDMTYDGDEHVYGILSTYRSNTYLPSSAYLSLLKFDVSDPFDWVCISSYDPSSRNHGIYRGISYDRANDVVWLAHTEQRLAIGYEFLDDGTMNRLLNTHVQDGIPTNTIVGMAVHDDTFIFRTYQTWQRDQVEVWEVRYGDLTLYPTTTRTTLSQNGVGLHYDGQRLITSDYYHNQPWYNRYMTEFGMGLAYDNPATFNPGTTYFYGEELRAIDSIVSVATRYRSTNVTAGDSVTYELSTDQGQTWVTTHTNSTTHMPVASNNLSWRVRLNGQSATSWWIELSPSTSYRSLGTWTSPMKHTASEIGKVRPVWIANTPANTGLMVEVTNDGGSTWLPAANGVVTEFSQSGRDVGIRVLLNSSDPKSTPALQELTLHYEEGFPRDVNIDVGDDGAVDFAMVGLLNAKQIFQGSNLVDALNAHIPQNGLGVVDIPLATTATSPGRVLFSDLEVRYEMRTRILDVQMDTTLLIPDDVSQPLVVRVALGTNIDAIERVTVNLSNANGENPSLLWDRTDGCSQTSSTSTALVLDGRNCSSYLDVNGILSLRFPIRTLWDWDDDNLITATLNVDDSVRNRVVAEWTTPTLGFSVENDVRLDGLSAVDESGRSLLPGDWMRGGTTLTLSGSISFEGTELAPPAGRFNLSIYGQNLTRDGDPDPSHQSELFVKEPNPAFGAYTLRFTTPIESTQGGMLFTVRAEDLPHGTSVHINPLQSNIRLVLDGQSPLVIGTTPSNGSELKSSSSQPIEIMVQDSVEPPDRITMNYWVESIHDGIDPNGKPNEDEYVSQILIGPQTLPGGILIFSTTIDDSRNELGDKVVMYFTGQDSQGNTIAMGGGPVCPTSFYGCFDDITGLDEHSNFLPDWDASRLIYTTRVEKAPVIDSDASFIFGHEDGESLHPGVTYDLNLNLSDENGWYDIRTVLISLTGQFGEDDPLIIATIDDGATTFISTSSDVAVSNLYSHLLPVGSFDIRMKVRFSIAWSADLIESMTHTVAVKVQDQPCIVRTDEPCHEESSSLGRGSWVFNADLDFDLGPGRFTAIELTSRRDVFADALRTSVVIGSGQVLRLQGRVQFTVDSSPCPEGGARVVIRFGDLSWGTIVGDHGEFQLDIIVPSTNGQDLLLDVGLEDLLREQAPERVNGPQILFKVDDESPLITSVEPSSGNISITTASDFYLTVEAHDDVGFDEDRPITVLWQVRAGEFIIGQGSKTMSNIDVSDVYALWEVSIDLTNGGNVVLLPSYVVNVWFIGSDLSRNPVDPTGNSEYSPAASFHFVQTGPLLNSHDLIAEWSNPRPEEGDSVTLTIQTVSPVQPDGNLTVILLHLGPDNIWVRDVSSTLQIVDGAGLLNIEVEPEPLHFGVSSSTEVRYKVIVQDGQIPMFELSVEPIVFRTEPSRGIEAFNKQVEQNFGSVLLFVVTMVAIAFALSTMIAHNRLRRDFIDQHYSDGEEETHEVDAIDSSNPPPPPPGLTLPGSAPPRPPGL